MTQPAHAERAHALLGASKASQWLNCPPSARLQESVPDKRSEYADEGTAAHELAEAILRRRLFPLNSKQRKEHDAVIARAKESPFYGPEMEHAVGEYVEFVEERFMAAKARSSDAVLLLEEEVDFTEWVPEGKGLNDVILISDGTLEVIDLKYGTGVPVSAIGNPQLRLYGLGAWSEYNYLYEINEIGMSIVQPRKDSITSDIVPIGELLEWADTIVRPAAELAYAGKGEMKQGSHCKFCRIKGDCPARKGENLQALAYEFRDPKRLTLEEIGQILPIADQLASWAKDVQEFAFEAVKRGDRVPGWKLVRGKSDRAFTDKEAVKAKLLDAGFTADKILKPQELIALGKLETTVVGKKQFNDLLKDLIVKPPGKPTLVVETDPRPELNSVDQDFAGEEFDA